MCIKRDVGAILGEESYLCMIYIVHCILYGYFFLTIPMGNGIDYLQSPIHHPLW